MIVHFGVDTMNAEWAGATVCVGVFDGVHLGHRAVISRAVAEAKSREQPCVLMTFDRHPAWILAPDKVPLPLASLSQNLDEYKKLGVAATVVLPFDERTASTTAQSFLDQTLKGVLKADCLVVGHDFALGKGREGDGRWLSEHIETHVVPAFEHEGHRVSSSEIRGLVTSGAVEKAASFLGRAYALRGAVVPGQRLGRQLGYPTANMVLSARQCVPLDGVYGGWCTTPYGRFLAATGIGLRPTVGGTKRTIEAYLLDFPNESLYGLTIDLGFSLRVRDELAFPNLDELSKAMREDVETVRERIRAEI